MIHASSSRSKALAPLRRISLLLPAGLVLSLGLFASDSAAQPGGGDSDSVALDEASVSYSFSSKGDVSREGKQGTAATGRFEFAASVSLPAPATWRFSSEISWSRDDFTLTGDVPLPDKLESFGLNFMAMKDLSDEFGRGWSAMAMINPSFASDSGKLSSDSFSLLALVGVEKEVSQAFSWNLGVVAMTRGDNKVLPMVGARWSFARDWSLSVGFPRTEVAYQLTESLSLNAGVSFHGGSYYVSRTPSPGLGDTYLDYQEFRLGAGAEYRIGRNLSVSVEAGMALDRRFDYYDRDFKLDGDSVAYGRFSLRYRF